MCWYRVLRSYRSYRRARYRVMFYRALRIVRYRHRRCTDTGANSGTDVHTGTGGTGIDDVPNLLSCPVLVLMSYQSHRSVRYRYPCHTELTEVSGTGIDFVPNISKCPVPAIDVVPNLPKCPVPVILQCIPPVCVGMYRTEHILAILYTPRHENQDNFDPDSKPNHFRPPHKNNPIMIPALKSSQFRSPHTELTAISTTHTTTKSIAVPILKPCHFRAVLLCVFYIPVHGLVIPQQQYVTVLP